MMIEIQTDSRRRALARSSSYSSIRRKSSCGSSSEYRVRLGFEGRSGGRSLVGGSLMGIYWLKALVWQAGCALARTHGFYSYSLILFPSRSRAFCLFTEFNNSTPYNRHHDPCRSADRQRLLFSWGAGGFVWS